jgi:hypothetical protein
MILMNLREWNTLTAEQRKAWMDSQSSRSLLELFIMIAEMLDQASEMDAELRTLEPNEDVNNARDFTVNTLRDVERHLTDTIRQKQLNVV